MQYQLTIEQASVRANRCARTIAKALAEGELKGPRRGARVYISSSQLDRWAAAQGITGGVVPLTAAEVLKVALELVREARLARRRDAV